MGSTVENNSNGINEYTDYKESFVNNMYDKINKLDA